MNFTGRFRAGLLSFATITTLVLLVTGCKKDDDNAVTVPTSFVSIYQASPDAPGLNILADANQINAQPFAFSDYTGYLRFYSGTRHLKFGPFGSDNVVIDTAVTLQNGQAYSVFVVDNYSKASILLLNDKADASSSTKANLRFLNLSPDTPGVDLASNDNATPIFSGQAFKASSDFKEVDPKQYDFQIKSGSNVLLSIPDVNLEAGWYYTIIVKGFTTPPVGNSNVLSAKVLVD